MRNLGLDVARAVAIIMVLVSHSRYFYSNNYAELSWMSIFGFLGVEIFFVLSGYLIGRILINDVIEVISWFNLRRFWLRRWLRTLPVYFLMLLILFTLGGKEFHWEYIIFIQNFSTTILYEYPVTWSLSIEEWFYFFIPLVLVVGLKIKKIWKVQFFFTICLSVILFSTLLKIFIVIAYNPSWSQGVRNQIYLRLDSIVLGVLFAGIKYYCPQIFSKVIHYNFWVFVVSVTGLAGISYYYIFWLNDGKLIDQSFFGRTLLFPVVSLFCGFLIISLEKSIVINESYNKHWSSKIFVFFSLTSYSIYLIHWDIFNFFHTFVSKEASKLEAISWSLIALFPVIIISHILYRYFELPIMNLRGKFQITK